MNMHDELVDRLQAEPFTPIVLVISSGERFTVANPRLVATGDLTMWIYPPKSDRGNLLYLRQLTALELLEPAA